MIIDRLISGICPKTTVSPECAPPYATACPIPFAGDSNSDVFTMLITRILGINRPQVFPLLGEFSLYKFTTREKTRVTRMAGDFR